MTRARGDRRPRRNNASCPARSKALLFSAGGDHAAAPSSPSRMGGLALISPTPSGRGGRAALALRAIAWASSQGRAQPGCSQSSASETVSLNVLAGLPTRLTAGCAAGCSCSPSLGEPNPRYGVGPLNIRPVGAVPADASAGTLPDWFLAGPLTPTHHVRPHSAGRPSAAPSRRLALAAQRRPPARRRGPFRHDLRGPGPSPGLRLHRGHSDPAGCSAGALHPAVGFHLDAGWRPCSSGPVHAPSSASCAGCGTLLPHCGAGLCPAQLGAAVHAARTGLNRHAGAPGSGLPSSWPAYSRSGA